MKGKPVCLCSCLHSPDTDESSRGKPGPRMADLSNTLDGRYLMAQAVDLNLSLMKWRMWPELDMTRLSNTKCLLLGAGTLGKTPLQLYLSFF